MPSNAIQSLKLQRTRYIVRQGEQLCACGAPVSNMLHTKCNHCGRIPIAQLGGHYLAEELFAQQESWLRKFNNTLRHIGKRTMTQCQLVSKMVSKHKGPTSLLALANLPNNADKPSIQQATLLMGLVHAVINKAHYHETMTTQERIACATNGVVEHYCNNRHLKRAFHYVDGRTTYYDPKLLTAIRYPDLHPQNQAKN